MKTSNLHQLTQEAITSIGAKKPLLAKQKIDEATTLLNSLMDNATNDSDLIELSKYEALIKLLNNKLK